MLIFISLNIFLSKLKIEKNETKTLLLQLPQGERTIRVHNSNFIYSNKWSNSRRAIGFKNP